MWSAAWWGGGGGALLALLALLLAARRRKRAPHPPHALPSPQHVQVFVARVTTAPTTGVNPARDTLALLATPADDSPPQIIVVQNSTQTTIAHSANNPQPSTSEPQPGSSNTPKTDPKIPKTTEFKGIPKLPLPEQWIHKRSFDYKFPPIPRPLAQLNSDLGAELSQESKAKKFSATRSPSLEKDDKSPFVSSARSVESEVFGFDPESVRKLSETEETMMSPKENTEKESPSNLRRFRSVSTRLNICSVNESPHEVSQERMEMQNSPRVLECSSAKEKSSTSKFDFSPKLLADCIASPRFFTPPETVSPMFFAEPSPKSVYYDTVRSPKFFAETPKDDSTIPQSPKALGDHLNRNGVEKPSSPRVLSAKPSPKIHSCNKENYFTFEQAISESASRMSPRPKKYAGRNSIERERFTPPADKDVKKYRRHNSCDTNYKNIELNITKSDDNKVEKIENSEDVVDCCAKIETLQIDVEKTELLPSPSKSAQARRQRLKSISLDSDNAKIIEQNLGLPIAKQMKDQMNEAYKNQEISTSCESMERYPKTPATENPMFKFEDESKDKEEQEPKSPDLKKKSLRQSSDTQSFLDMPRFSPKEFEITVTSEEGSTVIADCQTKRKSKPNLTIDLSIRDQALQQELLEFEKLYTTSEKVKTPTLKKKSTSLDSSEEGASLSLPQKKTLDVPQNSVSVPNTPKRQLKRILAQKSKDGGFGGGKLGFNSIQGNVERRLYMKGQDSGIFLKENHAALMLYQPGTSRMGSRTMSSFDENKTEPEKPPEINISGADNRNYQVDSGHTLGTNLLNYKQNLSVSSTNLKTLPEGVPSDDFEPSAEDEKLIKKLHRRNSNQSLFVSTHSLQSSNCSLSSTGTSCHNLATVRTSLSNFSLNSDNRKKLSLERRDSLSNAEHLTPRVICSSNASISGEGSSKNCLLQRRGSNNSLSLNLYSNAATLSRHSSNSSLNKEVKLGPKKGLLERRSSNTSLTLNINNSNPQLSVNRSLSISNYNLNGSTCNLSRYNSNHSIDNPPAEPKKGILERRSSNTSLTLNLQSQEPRALEIDETLIDTNLKELPHRDKHRKSLSTENLIPKSYKNRTRGPNEKSFGSHDNLWSTTFTEPDCPQNLTFVCGDQENEIIYAFGSRQEEQNFQQGFVRNITTKPLSPQTTSEDFRAYLANMQHLQNATSVLNREQLRDLNDLFQNGYSKVKCANLGEMHSCSGRVFEADPSNDNPQMTLPDPTPSQPCSEYQKVMLRNVHQEFWDMPTNFQEKPIVSGSHQKNRYKSILPNEHSRVILKPDAGSMTEGYINANYIKGHEYTKNSYIATQGPLPNTIYDFWLMVHQNTLDFKARYPDPGLLGVQKIVMLTNFHENHRTKCEKYFPLELNEELTIDSQEYTESTCFFDDTVLLKNSFSIKNVGMVKKSGYTIRKLDVRYRNNTKSDSDISDSDSLVAYHYWFHNWADHKCPNDVTSLLNLSLDVLKDVCHDFANTPDEKNEVCTCDSPRDDSKFVFPPTGKENVKCEVSTNYFHVSPVRFAIDTCPPTIVHCSAGVGRTGCFIAILNGIKQLTNEQKVDVLGIVCNMRLNRGGMVQNSEQYELIHKVLCLFEQACLGL